MSVSGKISDLPDAIRYDLIDVIADGEKLKMTFNRYNKVERVVEGISYKVAYHVNQFEVTYGTGDVGGVYHVDIWCDGALTFTILGRELLEKFLESVRSI